MHLVDLPDGGGGIVVTIPVVDGAGGISRPALAAIVPKIAVGWKPALCTAFGTMRQSRQIVSTPTAMPR